jgi:phosphohistidine phosphatase
MVESGYRHLIVLRHAKTEQTARSDRARVLTSRGRTDARSAGRWLRENDIQPDLVLVSPAARARETAELVTAELSAPPEVRVVEGLYDASTGEALEVVAAVDGSARAVLLVGHNPAMADLVHALQRDPAGPSPQHLPTSGVAVLEVTAEWARLAEGTAQLTQWHVPRG